MDYPYAGLGPALSALALVFLLVMAAAALGLVVVLASLPGWVAANRGHPQATAVNLLGWLGLPTGVLWVVALVWAYWRSPRAHAEVAPELARRVSDLEATIAALEHHRTGGAR